MRTPNLTGHDNMWTDGQTNRWQIMMLTHTILQFTAANVPKPTVHITAMKQYACQCNLISKFQCFTMHFSIQ